MPSTPMSAVSDVSAVTVELAVLSGYAMANDELAPGALLSPEDLSATQQELGEGDSLRDFLVEELYGEFARLGSNAAEPLNSPAHWQEAVRRADTILRQVMTVRDTLLEHAPR